MIERAPARPRGRRDRIVDATVSVIAVNGLRNAHVNDIASLAETSSGLVLYHFGSLAGALDEAVAAVHNGFVARLQSALDGQAPPPQQLAAVARAVGEPIDGCNGWRLWLELWSRGLHDEGAATTGRERDRLLTEALSHIAGPARGQLDAAAGVARSVSALNGVGIALALSGAETDSMVTDWVDLTMRELGLSTHP